MKAIASVDENWAIGQKGRLLVSIPSDSRSFRERTEGEVVVMGRKTLLSLPNERPLARRETIVLTSDPNFRKSGVTVVHSVEEAIQKTGEYAGREIYLAGGESIYRQFLPFCDTAFITKIQHRYEADAYFPNLDEDPEWTCTEESGEQTYFDLEYYFLKYERVKR